MRSSWLLATTLLFRVCGREAPQPPTVASAPGALVAEHGGAVGFGAGLSAEVVAVPDGRIVAYVRDGQRAPVTSPDVRVSVRRPDGVIEPVPVAYDATVQAYVGRPAGLNPGAYPVLVSLQSTPAAPPMLIETPPVTVAAVTAPPPPRHGGRVQVVGDHAVEMVPLHSGEVAMFWTDLYGYPLQPSEVSVPSVSVTVNGRVETVVPRPEGDHYVARASVIVPQQPVSFALPRVVVRGMPFGYVAVESAPVLPALPRVTLPLPPRPAITASAGFPPPLVVGAPAPMPTPGVNVRVNVNVGGMPTPGVMMPPALPSPVVVAPAPAPMPVPAAMPVPTFPSPHVVVAGSMPAPAPAPAPAPMPPTVVVRPPQPGVVVVAPPPQPVPVVVAAPAPQPVVVVEQPGHVPQGRAVGYWRNRGVEAGPPPGQAGGGGGGGGEDRGHGGGGDDDRGHGGGGGGGGGGEGHGHGHGH